MRSRRGNQCSIGDIIAGIVNKNSPPTNKRRSISQRHQHSRRSLLSRRNDAAFLSRQSSMQQPPKQKGQFLPSFENWLSSTPKTPSRLFYTHSIDKPVPVVRKQSSSREIGIDNPQPKHSKCQLYETYGPFRRKSSKLSHYEDAASPKVAAKLIDSFRQIKIHAKGQSRTASQFHPSPLKIHDLTVKVNSTLVTLPSRGNNETPLVRCRQSPFRTFYR